MKKPILFIALILGSFVGQAQFTKASLTAAGLTCAMCTKAIYNALQQLPPVKSVVADIRSSAFLIGFKEGTAVDPDLLKKAVEEAGFSVARLKLTGNFDNLEVKNDSHIEVAGKTFHFLNISPTVLKGTQTLTVVDKNYVTGREFKKYTAATDMSCIETGKASECCAKLGVANVRRIYHVTL